MRTTKNVGGLTMFIAHQEDEEEEVGNLSIGQLQAKKKANQTTPIQRGWVM